MVLFRRFFAMLNYVENLFLSKNEGIGDHFCPKQRVLNKRKNVCTSCAKQECVVKHRLWRTSVSRICRTVSESLWRKLINSMDFVGGVHDRLCFARDRGMADLYEKYMAYCACQHLVTKKSRRKSSFRAGVRVLDIQRSKKSSVTQHGVLQDAYAYMST